jgi:hypothetical protein
VLYNAVTKVLQECYKGVTRVLQVPYLKLADGVKRSEKRRCCDAPVRVMVLDSVVVIIVALW